ncbi:hypothetical protein A2229_02960 [Candidatus Peregrinibacteria bacterium RIFOXYA2_FULL_33_7]|nr:MAG: hypothetical protein A2229_02960 [Candidatus Peregrinibacteria bacterium RIFOXYA2_FULL_33_7]
MITLDYKNLFQISEKHGLTEKELEKYKNSTPQYLKNIKSLNQGFYKVFSENNTIKDIQKFAQEKNKFKDIVVLGIGGSALGTICLKKAFSHLFQERTPRVHILDNIDPTIFAEIEDILNYEKTLFIVVTKSGETPETLSQYFYFYKKIKEKKLAPQEHFVFITDPTQGLLRKISIEENITTFPVPMNIGGRFSVLTAVGLLPAAFMGIDIEKLLIGAEKMARNFLNEDFEQNLPFQIALIQYLLAQKGKNITVMMPYAQKLYSFADWYCQLLAESIGKKLNNDKKEIFVGLTPVKSLGVTDQHSQLQLYNEGPFDKLIIFLEVENFGQEITIPNVYPEKKEFQFLKNISFKKLLQTEKKATEQALTKNNRPNITIKIPELNEENLGSLFMLFEASIAFLGEFFNINAFDQPGVELGKILTKEMLK